MKSDWLIGSRLFIFTVLALGLCSGARAEESRRAQVAAATADAVERLYGQISPLPAGPALTVQQFLDQMQARSEMISKLRSAEQIGPPRWINGQTCQVQLQISSAAVARLLQDLITADPQRAVLETDTLAQHARQWEAETFSATGSAIAAEAVEQIRPPDSAEAWQNIADIDRRQAIIEARSSAVRSVMDSLSPARITYMGLEATLGQAFRQMPQVSRTLTEWLAARPVTSLQFHDDLRVELAIYVTAEDLVEVLVRAVEEDAHMELEGPLVQHLHEIVRRRMAPAVGHGAVTRPAGVDEPAVQVPTVLPQWINRQLEVEGTAAFVETPLKTARAAEANAREQLREQIAGLAWHDERTIADAAEADPQVARVIETILSGARITRTDYQPDQSAQVFMMLDLKELWEALRAASPRVGRASSAPADTN